MGFYNWLQGKNAEGEELPEGVGKRTSRDSAITTHGLMRGFYTHNGLVFPKGCKVPKRTGSKVSQRDDKVEIYGYDEESDSMTYNSDLLQHFFTNLSFRDQTLATGLISTGADAADILTLNVGFTKDLKGNIIIHYTGEIPEEELREIVVEAKQGKLKPQRKSLK